MTTAEHYDEIAKRVKSVVAEILRIDGSTITMQSKIREDLGADSLDITTLLMALEDEFKEEISDEEAQKIQTIDNAITFIAQKSLS